MPMYDPPHPGEMIRDILEDEEVGWTVTECARRLNVTRNTLSRLLNGHLGISPRMALALERIGWSYADHWMRLQAAYELAQERLKNADNFQLMYGPCNKLKRTRSHSHLMAESGPAGFADVELNAIESHCFGFANFVAQVQPYAFLERLA